MSRVMNFNAGPATLPLPALARARDELLDLGGSGMSVIEHSHRGKEYTAVHDEAVALLRDLAEVPDAYDVLFFQGGASTQFAQVPLAFLPPGSSADFVVNGSWGTKALAEAAIVAKMVGARARAAATTTMRIPTAAEIDLDPRAAYVHYTRNETIDGVQWHEVPAAPEGVPLVCDMSSDFLWRPLDVRPYALIYAGAQKNLGPSGLVVVLARKDFVARGRKDIPKMWRYDVFAENGSRYNTPPTFAVYLMRNVLSWVKAEGGLAAIEQVNRQKAAAIYDVIDAFPDVYRCPVERGSRSVMNVVFRMPTEELERQLIAKAKGRGMVGIKGHRTVGGVRVSLYNAVPLEWAEALAALMREVATSSA